MALKGEGGDRANPELGEVLRERSQPEVLSDRSVLSQIRPVGTAALELRLQRGPSFGVGGREC